MTLERTQLVSSDPESATAPDVVTVPSVPSATGAAQLIPVASYLRYRARDLHSDVSSLSRDVFMAALNERGVALQRQSVRSLLDLLVDSGLGWSTMSRLLGVSIPAIRKWRKGEGSTPANRQAVARLTALMQMLAEQFMIDDPAAWLEIPLANTRYSLVDVYANNKVDLLLEHANAWRGPEELLDAISSTWRQETSEFETFVDEEGAIGLRTRERR